MLKRMLTIRTVDRRLRSPAAPRGHAGLIFNNNNKTVIFLACSPGFDPEQRRPTQRSPLGPYGVSEHAVYCGPHVLEATYRRCLLILYVIYIIFLRLV
jgi:hypothetical protein